MIEINSDSIDSQPRPLKDLNKEVNISITTINDINSTDATDTTHQPTIDIVNGSSIGTVISTDSINTMDSINITTSTSPAPDTQPEARLLGVSSTTTFTSTYPPFNATENQSANDLLPTSLLKPTRPRIASASPRLLPSHSSPTLRTQRSTSWSPHITKKLSKNDLSDDASNFDFEDNSTLFNGCLARMTQFTIPNYDITRDYDSPPNLTLRTSESIVSEGKLQIYKILGKRAAFLQCGKFVHPILPRLRLWRVASKVFVLPQPNPGKFWRIELLTGTKEDDKMESNDIEELENVLAEACFYKNVTLNGEGEEWENEELPAEDKVDVQVVEDIEKEINPDSVEACLEEESNSQDLSKVCSKEQAEKKLVVTEESNELERDVNVQENSLEESEVIQVDTEEQAQEQEEVQAEVQAEVQGLTKQQLQDQSSEPYGEPEKFISTPPPPSPTHEQSLSDPLDLPKDVQGIVDLSTIGHDSPSSPLTTFPYSDNTSSSSTLDEILDAFDDSPYHSISPILIDEGSPLIDKIKSLPVTSSEEILDDSCSRKGSLYNSTDVDSLQERSPTPMTSTSSLSTITTAKEIELPELLVDSKYPRFQPSTFPSTFVNHPFVPISQLYTNQPPSRLQFRPLEDDWLEVDVPVGVKPTVNYQTSLSLRPGLGYLNWVAQVTGDIVSSSSNYVEAKIEQRRISGSRPSLSTGANSTIINMTNSGRTSPTIREYENRILSNNSSPYSSSSSKSPSPSPTPALPILATSTPPEPTPEVPQPDFYQQAVIVSGYMGWQLLNKVIPPWVRR